MNKQDPLPSSAFPNSIPDDEIQLWCVIGEDIDDEDFVRLNKTCLCEDERTRAERFHRPSDRHRFIVGRGILRSALGRFFDIEPHHVSFSRNRYGRPEVSQRGGKQVYFNVSHTEGMVALAIATRTEVGVDAEQIRFDLPYLELARRYFNRAAYADLENSPPSTQCSRFYEYWVLWEAYAKALGVGLSLLPTDPIFALDKSDGGPCLRTLHKQACDWHFWLMAPSSNLRLAVAAAKTNCKLVVRRLRPNGPETIHLPILRHWRISKTFCEVPDA